MLIHPPPDPSEANLLPGRVKLQAVVGIEKWAAGFLITGIAILVLAAMLGPGKRGRAGLLSPQKQTRVILLGAAPLVGLAGLMWLLFDNHYVLDRDRRRILLHRGLRFAGNDTIVAEAEQIAAVGFNVDKRTGKHGQIGWTLSPIILLRDNTSIKLSSWSDDLECTKLAHYQAQVCCWAAALRCAWIEPPRGIHRMDPTEVLRQVAWLESQSGSSAGRGAFESKEETAPASEEALPPRLRPSSPDDSSDASHA
jgi:hypothetical protein